MSKVFVAYATTSEMHSELIVRAAASASQPRRTVTPWVSRDTSGYPIAKSVEGWIEDADCVVADVSVVNDNVTFEIGLAIGMGKPCRLVRSESFDFKPVREIALLHTLGHESYGGEHALTNLLKKEEEASKWSEVHKNRDQPVFVLQPPNPTDWSTRMTSALKKTAKLKFRSFNPSEVSRLSAMEAYESVCSSYGIIATWMTGNDDAARRNNQRAAFAFGVARGRGIPAVLIAHETQALPLDLHDLATRWEKFSDFEKIASEFRDSVADLQNDFIETKSVGGGFLDQITCGDPTAENEATELSRYFLETDSYQKALGGSANVFVGRKGSGKTAIFLQVRDRTRSDKSNIIIDLIPDGHQLIKMKEFILDQLSLGARKEVIAAFWEYVLWLEIAYKLLEKDQQRALRDSDLLVRYEGLQKVFLERVDTGSGDFSERLNRLSEKVVDRFRKIAGELGDLRQLDGSKVLQIVYGQDIRNLRDAVISYLHIKGYVYFLMDNLDRFWTPGGFDQDDALIVIGLIESMQEITRKFRKSKLDFFWAIFVRSDVYEFLIQGMADYGKLAVQSLEWSDKELLKVLFEKRISRSANLRDGSWKAVWQTISDQHVNGAGVLDFLVQGSLMRPRYLIRLFETARGRAITLGKQRITEDDYKFALRELGWQVLEDLDREMSDLVPNASDLLFEILQAGDNLTVSKLRHIASRKIADTNVINRLIDVMLWNGSLGIQERGDVKYIFDCGYKRPYLATLINGPVDAVVQLHPTIKAALL